MTWSEFSAIAQDTARDPILNSEWWWRGQGSDWQLSSAWERLLIRLGVDPWQRSGQKKIWQTFKFSPFNGFSRLPDNEDAFLEQFRDVVRSNDALGVPDQTLNDRDSLLALGRHYGLTTPLLDWTMSPYIAAFFAYADAIRLDTKECFVYSIYNHRYIDGRHQRCPPIRFIDSAKLIGLGDQLFARLRAQQGCFTLNESSFLMLRNPDMDLRYLREYKLNTSDARYALRDLALMGIRYSSLFPDLAGAALDTNLTCLVNKDPETLGKIPPDHTMYPLGHGAQ